MASNFIKRCMIFALVLTVCISVIPTPALAGATADLTPIEEHTFKFYLDPALAPDMAFAKAVLPKYVSDMNTILAKNTNRRLVFDPETDIILTNSAPQSNSATPPLPTEGFEIWAYAVSSTLQVSYGGYASIDTSGAGVLAGLKWVRIYDTDNLTSDELVDYWTQINNMLHEMAHVFGAGIGEYYTLATVNDTTGVDPLLNIDVTDPSDVYWSDKPDFLTDPLLLNPVRTQRFNWITSRADLLSVVQYSNLTSTIMDGSYRNSFPLTDFSHITVQVLDENDSPLNAAEVKVWSVIGDAQNTSQLMVDSPTDASGQVIFAWGGQANPHNSRDLLRLVKVYSDGYTAQAKYISVFDADISKLVDGNNTFTVTIKLQKVAPPAPTATFQDVPVSYWAWSYVESLYADKITGGCSTSPLLYCPDESITRAELSIFIERAIHGASFLPPVSPSSFGDTANHWAKDWIEAFAADKITGGCGNGNFCPDNDASRAEMAVFLLRAEHGAAYTPPTPTGTMFTDVPATYWAAGWIEQLAKEGITGGCGGSQFCPNIPVTRSQMAAFIVRAFGLP